MHANWQAAQFLKLAEPVKTTRQHSNLADLANRVMGGRYTADATSDPPAIDRGA